MNLNKLLISLVLFTTSAGNICAVNNVTVGGLKYSLLKDEAQLCCQDDTLGGDITVPESITYVETVYQVTSLADKCFSHCRITGVKIPASVTVMGSNCMASCTNLKTAEIMAEVNSLNDSCFYNCLSLNQVTLPVSLLSVGVSCFENCTSLNKIKIPSSVKSLGDNCFYSCIGLTNVDIPISLSSLGKKCFGGCAALGGILLPSALSKLEDGCFEYCSSLTNVFLPMSVKSLGNNCFTMCTNMKTITLYPSVKMLGDECFSGCSSLVKFKMPSAVVSIGFRCFYDCSNLYEIDLPFGITDIGAGCFDGCTSLNTVTCHWKKFNGVNVDEDNFTAIPTTVVLNVPTDMTIQYKHRKPWSNFSHFKEFVDTKVHDATNVATVRREGSYVVVSGLNDGERVTCYTRGGVLLDEALSSGNRTLLYVGSKKTAVIIVKFGKTSVKCL